MALSILNNIPSLMAQNQLNITNKNLQTTLEQLSSGSRVNSGADDAAGLAIANGLQANIMALNQSESNANDAIGNLQTADGALGQVTTLLDRAVTLATEASNTGLTGAQAQALDGEYTTIKNEINRIGQTTTFNGAQVFSGNAVGAFMSDATTQGTGSPITVNPGSLTTTSIGLGGVATGTLSAISNFTANDTITIGPNGNTTQYTFVSSLTGVAGQVLIGSGGANTAANTALSLLHLEEAINGGANAGTDYVATNPTANAQVTAGSLTNSTLTLSAIQGGTGGNSIGTTSSDIAVATFSGATLAGGSAGANLLSVASAQSALTSINDAIATVAANRGTIGAGINQLTAAVNVAQAQVQNITCQGKVEMS
jgi:flagellin